MYRGINILQIKSLSRTLCEFAEAQGRPSPARLPRQHEVSHMLKNMEIVKQLLQQFHAPLPSPDTESGRGTLQGIIDASESLSRPQHVSERPTGPNLVSYYRAETSAYLTTNSPASARGDVTSAKRIMFTHLRRGSTEKRTYVGLVSFSAQGKKPKGF